MKLTSFALATGALIFGLTGCSTPAADETKLANETAVATKTDATTPAAETKAPDAGTAKDAAPEAAPNAPATPPKADGKAATTDSSEKAPDAPNQDKPAAPKDQPKPQENAPNPVKGSDRYATPKGEAGEVPIKGERSEVKVSSEPVKDKKPTMTPLKNWKAPSASGNFKPYAGTWAMQIGPKMAELNAKLKKQGKLVPKFEFVLSPNGTFKFSQGKRLTTGVVQVKGADIMLMPTAIDGKKPQFEQETKPYVFQNKGGAMFFMLGGKQGSKFVRS